MDLVVVLIKRLNIFLNMYNPCFPLCKQLCTFMIYGYFQAKNSQNYISKDSNSYKIEKEKYVFH